MTLLAQDESLDVTNRFIQSESGLLANVKKQTIQALQAGADTMLEENTTDAIASGSGVGLSDRQIVKIFKLVLDKRLEIMSNG